MFALSSDQALTLLGQWSTAEAELTLEGDDGVRFAVQYSPQKGEASGGALRGYELPRWCSRFAIGGDDEVEIVRPDGQGPWRIRKVGSVDQHRAGDLMIGRKYARIGSARGDAPTPSRVYLPSADLQTHILIFGATGSGKTCLGKAIVEEAAMSGVPAIVVDLKGDLSSLAIAAAEATCSRSADDREAEATRAGVSRYKQTVEVRVFTPGSDKGLPLAIAPALSAPEDLPAIQDAELASLLTSATGALLARLGSRRGGQGEPERDFLEKLLRHCWETGVSLEGIRGIKMLVRLCRKPPFDAIGELPLGEHLPKGAGGLAQKLNSLTAGSKSRWFEGKPLDVAGTFLLASAPGKTPINVVNISHLDSEDDRTFLIYELASAIRRWMRTQGGSDRPRLLFYVDEIGSSSGKALFPSHDGGSITKPELNYLVRQGRAYGVCCLFATQNPGDIDYKALSNVGTVITGRLSTKRDREKVMECIGGLDGLDKGFAEKAMATAHSRDFIMRDVRNKVLAFQSRILCTEHRLLTMDEIGLLE